ncbi:MAG: hypothetical protein RLY50_132 [Actinomycetota bacterium]
MKKIRKSQKLAGALLGAALVLAACGGSSDSDTDAGDTGGGGKWAAGESVMTITYDIAEAAVWDDGSAITWEDFECTALAALKTPGSIAPGGYDKITGIAEGDSAKQVVVDFNAPYAPWKGLFGGLIKKEAVANCEDVSQDMQTSLPFSGNQWKMESWSADQVVYVPNENYWGTNKASGKLVMVPKVETQIPALKAGEVDFIYPQFYDGLTKELEDANIKLSVGFGSQYEALYFNLGVDGKDADGNTRAFSDPAYREAFYKAIDLDALFNQIYAPLVDGASLLKCGPIVPGPFCPEGLFGNKYDLAAVETIMTGAGYEKDGSGMWAKDGTVPTVKWVVNTGNTRRESTQAYLIPLMKKAGFNVEPYNCDADCYFQQRLPGMDYDLAMYINVAPPDPGSLVSSFAGDKVPTEANGNTGQNFQGWVNETATEALNASDIEPVAAKREELIKTAIAEIDKDYIMVPLYQFPNLGAYRSDKVNNVEGQLNNNAAFYDTFLWEDVDGDGQIVVGAEQWPSCLNPVTECANSSWAVWTGTQNVLPGVWLTTNDGDYELSEMMAGEPKVEVKG